jgi:hypothetical protein
MVDPLRKYDGEILWADNKIKPGKEWRTEIFRALDRASVAVLLVSRAREHRDHPAV